MPLTRRQQLFFTPLMCAIMVLFMTFAILAIQSGSISAATVLGALRSFPMAYAFALTIELLAIAKFAKFVAAKIVAPKENSTRSIILSVSFCMVFCMSFCMSWFGSILRFGFSASAAGAFLHSWPRNFMIALFFQWLAAGPAARRIIRLV